MTLDDEVVQQIVISALKDDYKFLTKQIVDGWNKAISLTSNNTVTENLAADAMYRNAVETVLKYYMHKEDFDNFRAEIEKELKEGKYGSRT